MESQSEEIGSRFDRPLLLAAVLLAVAGLGAFYYFDPRLALLPRLAILLLGFAAAGVLVARTALGVEVWSYLTGARVEMRKVVWPTRQESLQTTLVVAGFVLLVALILWGLDSLLLFGVQHLTGRSA
jgi:preprotein translocase subunit SecE